MKLQLFLISIFISVSFIQCGENNTEMEPINDSSDVIVKEINTKQYDMPLSECIHNALYYLENTDIKNYDSIDTHYFHEVLGYTNKEALSIEKKIHSFNQIIHDDTTNLLSEITKEEYRMEIIDLKQELHYYDKEVIGFVFVHTYAINQDTLSAIIVMNKNCSSAEAIPVNAIKDIDPSDYSYKVETIESKI